MKVLVTVGIGAWKATARIVLVACPHVGDFIVLPSGVSIACDRVSIGTDGVLVEQTIRFGSQQEADDFFTNETYEDW